MLYFDQSAIIGNGWKGAREDSQPVSFKARPISALSFLQAAVPQYRGTGKADKVLCLFVVLFILKTPTGSGVVLELLYIADSGRIAETSMTFPFPSGD